MNKTLLNKKAIFGIVALALIVAAGYVSANDIIGSVSVVEPKMTLSNLALPSNINPTEISEIMFDMTDLDTFNGMESLEFWAWHSSVVETATSDKATRYYAKQGQGSVLINEEPMDWVKQFTIYDAFDPYQFYEYSLNVSFDATAKAGTWNFKVKCLEVGGDNSIITGTFTMNTYMQLSIAESSFSFGEVQQGMINIQISDPTNGYLTANIISNYDTKLQVSGTNPTDGSNSFAVSNIKIYDADLLASATPLTGTPTDLNGDIYSGVSSAFVYLWVSIPAGTPLGVYTFTLTISLIAV